MPETHDLLFIGSGRTVAALDRLTGKTVWRIKLPRLFGSPLTLMTHGSELYAGRGGYVYCIDQRNGTILWERGVNSSGGMVFMTSNGGSASAQAAAGHVVAQQQAATTAAVVASAAAAAAAAG